MKFIHLADLHFGKSIHNVSLLDEGDQRAWADRFIELLGKEQPDAVLIAGDVYDRSQPSGEAVELLSDFLTKITEKGKEKGITVMVIPGNHDSAQRLAFAGKLLEKNGLYIASSVKNGIQKVTLTDAYGPVDFWLVPYVFPKLVAEVLGDESIPGGDYDTAMRRLLANEQIDFSHRNVIVAHQNVLANGEKPKRTGSESMVGGVGEIDFTAFDGFDYVALGHIHGAQAMGRREVRYAGTPLCYHFEELNRPEKGPVIVEMGAKGEPLTIRTETIAPLHPMRVIRGTYDEILGQEKEAAGGEYLKIELTDEQPPKEAHAALNAFFAAKKSKVVEFGHVPASGQRFETAEGNVMEEKGLDELFAVFYESRLGEAPGADTEAFIRRVAQQIEIAGAEAQPTDADADELIRLLTEQEGMR